MKKALIMLLAVMMAVPALAASKPYKKKIKEFKRAGWEIYASSRTLEEAVRLHCEALEKGGVYELSGTATGIKSPGVGRQIAMNNACVDYVQQEGRFLRGRIASDAYADECPEEEFSHFYSAYENLLQKEINGEIRPSFTLVRTVGDGTCQMMSFFIVDEDAASRARIKAMEAAARESEVAQEIARRIREYVDEGFAPVAVTAEEK